MFCTQCGAPASENARFCTQCGKPFAVKQEIKGRHWPAMAALAVMLLIGFLVYAITAAFGEETLAVPGNTLSAAQEESWFQVDAGTLSFHQELYSGSQELTVPGTLNGQTVRFLGEECFYDCRELTTVILPDTLEIVGEAAFAECDALRGIYLPERVTEIGDRAFANCEALEALWIPGTVEYISPSAFFRCGKLNHIYFTGTRAQWRALFDDPILADTHVYCEDGIIYQGIYGG